MPFTFTFSLSYLVLISERTTISSIDSISNNQSTHGLYYNRTISTLLENIHNRTTTSIRFQEPNFPLFQKPKSIFYNYKSKILTCKQLIVMYKMFNQSVNRIYLKKYDKSI